MSPPWDATAKPVLAVLKYIKALDVLTAFILWGIITSSSLL